MTKSNDIFTHEGELDQSEEGTLVIEGNGSGPTTYMWLTGHVRNIGDSALRRPYAAAAAAAGPIRVWSGAMSSGYSIGLRVPTSSLSSSFLRWVASFIRSVMRVRTNFAFNAGEFAVTREYFFGMILLLPWLAIAKLRGGKVIWLGAGMTSPRRLFMWPFHCLARMADLVKWRDSTACLTMGDGPRMPDWAFGLPPVTRSSRRPYLAVSLRGDRRYPSEGWIVAVQQACAQLSLVPVVVVQVEDDQVMAKRLAADLGAKLIGWSATDHLEQEMIVRNAYGLSAAIVSDRLHALIIGLTEGSVPLGWVDRSNSKILRHFDWLGGSWVWIEPKMSSTRLADLEPAELSALRVEASRLRRRTRRDVEAVASEVTRLLT